MKRFCAVLIVLAAIPILSCGDNDQPTKPAGPIPIAPLSEGAKWSGMQYLDDSIVAMLWLDSITRDTLIWGEQWFFVTHVRGDDTFPDARLLALRDIGLWQLWPSSITQPVLIAKYPASVGEVFSEEEDGSHYHVASIDTTITVPMGTFHCFHYTYDTGNADGAPQDIFYSPGVGRVYLHQRTGGFWMTTFTWVLEDFKY